MFLVILDQRSNHTNNALQVFWAVLRGWIQLILLVILVAGGLMLRLCGLYFDVFFMRLCH
jgi:uncharacterized membrane protein